MSKSSLTIVKKMHSLNYYEKNNLDPGCQKLIEECLLETAKSYPDLHRPFLNLLNCHLHLQEKELTLATLDGKQISHALSTLEHSVINRRIVTYKDTGQFSLNVKRLSDLLREQYPGVLIKDCDQIKEGKDYFYSKEIADYYSGWYAHDKNGRSKFLSLQPVHHVYGKGVTRSLEKKIDRHTSGKNLLNTIVPPINGYLTFLGDKKYLTPQLANDPYFASSTVKEYCKEFFVDYADRSLCIETGIKRWNDSRHYFKACLFNSDFMSSDTTFPYVPPKRKTGSSTNIKKTSDGVKIKVNPSVA